MQVDWPELLLKHPEACKVVDRGSQELLFCGLRTRCALHYDEQALGAEAATTTLREMLSHAKGGQIVLAHDLYKRIRSANFCMPAVFYKLQEKLQTGPVQAVLLYHLYSSALEARIMHLPSEEVCAAEPSASDMWGQLMADGRPTRVGDVALVFLDVQGAPALLEQNPVGMGRALQVYAGLVRRLLADNGGFVVQEWGTAFQVRARVPP